MWNHSLKETKCWELSIITLMPECGIKYARTQIHSSTAFQKLACCLFRCHFWHHRSGTEEHLEGFVIIHEALWGIHLSRIFLNAVLHKTNHIQARVYWDTELEGDLWLSTGTDVNSALLKAFIRSASSGRKRDDAWHKSIPGCGCKK